MPDLDALLLAESLPKELEAAPAWARLIYAQNRGLAAMLGEEPKADGSGGSGLIGDIRRIDRTLLGLINLKAQGAGFLAALTLFGALILLGVTHWIQSITSAAK